MSGNRPANISSFDSSQRRVIEHIYDLLNEDQPQTTTTRLEVRRTSGGGGTQVDDWDDFTNAVSETSDTLVITKIITVPQIIVDTSVSAGTVDADTVEVSDSIVLVDTDGDGSLAWDFTAARTLTLPDADDTLVGRDTSDTLTNKTIDASNNTLSNLAHGGEVDNPSSGVHGATGDIVGSTDTQTLTNKTIDADSNTLSNLEHGSEVDDPASGVHGVTGDVVGTTDSQNLTNKTVDGRAVSTADNVVITTTTVADSTTETTVYTAPVGAGELEAGKMYKVTILGRYSTANATDTFDLVLNIGSTTISTTTSVAASVTDGGIYVTFFVTVRSTGATGEVVAYTNAKFDDVDQDSPGSGPVTIDTTASQDITATVQWSLADPGNTLSIEQGVTEVLN